MISYRQRGGAFIWRVLVWFRHCTSLPLAFLLRPSVESVKMSLFVYVCVGHSTSRLVRLRELMTTYAIPHPPLTFLMHLYPFFLRALTRHMPHVDAVAHTETHRHAQQRGSWLCLNCLILPNGFSIQGLTP